jgi:hypothetical protein
MLDITIYEDPTPVEIRGIVNGFVYFSERLGTRWEIFYRGHLVGVGETKSQVMEYYKQASAHKNHSTI